MKKIAMKPMNLSIVLIAFSFSVAAYSGELISKFFGKPVGNQLEISIVPPRNYHINPHAPVTFMRKKLNTRVKPLKLSEKEMLFQIPSLREEKFEVHFYICDNAQTVCEKQDFNLAWDGKELKSALQN